MKQMEDWKKYQSVTIIAEDFRSIYNHLLIQMTGTAAQSFNRDCLGAIIVPESSTFHYKQRKIRDK